MLPGLLMTAAIIRLNNKHEFEKRKMRGQHHKELLSPSSKELKLSMIPCIRICPRNNFN